jgi:hypothetical protein
VYNCTGNPHPADIQRVVESMMSDEFGTSFNRVSQILLCGLQLTNSHHATQDGERSGIARPHHWRIRLSANGGTA